MKIFIDFDGVIFDAKKFKNALARICAKNGMVRKDFFHIYALAKENGEVYSVSHHLRLLARHAKNRIQKKTLRIAIDRLMSDLRSYVFKDVFRFFDRMHKHDLYCVSFGDPAFQRRKIEGSGVKRYFKRVIVTRGDKGKEIAALCKKNSTSDEQIVFVDDSEKHIREVRSIKNAVIIHLCRGKNVPRSPNADYRVSTLAQATRVILSL
ncbi:MAG: hypothetical protein AAB598_01775 [Patescibacteria group bacterium]